MDRIPIPKIFFCASILFLSSSFAFADEDRHLAVDQAIGGMKEGSRIGAPGTTPIPITDAHKTISSSQGTQQAGPGPVSVGASTQTNNPVNTTGPAGSESVPGQPGTGETGGPLEAGTGETGETPTEGGGLEPGAQEPSGDSGNPIVDVGAGADLESGTVEADATVDTTGELEEKPVFEADLEAEAADGTQESNPIVDTQVSIDLESGTVEADATVDTSGELEERQILDADFAAGETTTEAEAGSATDITQSDIVESADVTTQPVQSVIPVPADLAAEVDTTGETTGGEADVGVEADVSGTSEAEDVICDPVDGLTSSAACADLKL